MNGTPTLSNQDGKILNVLWNLKKLGRANNTIKGISKCLYVLKEHAPGKLEFARFSVKWEKVIQLTLLYRKY